jgi:hypothetical protein
MEFQNSLVEGWLHKKKSKDSKKYFGKFTKRWFTLDIKNALFSYASAQNKKSKKDIPLRELTKVEVPDHKFNKQPKDWDYEFTVITKDRVYHLYAQTDEFRKHWITAFETILENKGSTEEPKDEKKSKKSKKKKNKKKKDLDIDKIIQKGPRATVQLGEVISLEGIESNDQPFSKLYSKQISGLYSSNSNSDRKESQESMTKESSEHVSKADSGEIRERVDSDPVVHSSFKPEVVEDFHHSSEESFEDDWDNDESYASIKDVQSNLMSNQKATNAKKSKYPVQYPSRALISGL